MVKIRRNIVHIAGAWRELAGNVNGLARNLTSQVRNIAEMMEELDGLGWNN